MIKESSQISIEKITFQIIVLPSGFQLDPRFKCLKINN